METKKYTNNQLDATQLSPADEIDWIKVSRALVHKNTMRNAIIGFFVAIAGLLPLLIFLVLLILGSTQSDSVSPFVTALLAVLALILFGVVVCILIWPRFEVPQRGYAMREFNIVDKSGLINRVRSSVPFTRIQHVVTVQGLLDRMFGLMVVQIHTAGGPTLIKGLKVAVAQELREQILRRVRELGENDVEESERHEDIENLAEIEDSPSDVQSTP